jgi:hypothetical protein
VAKCKDQLFDTLKAMEAERAAPPEMLKTLCSYTTDQGIKFTFKAGPPPRHLFNRGNKTFTFVRTRLHKHIALGAVQFRPTGVDCPYMQPLYVIINENIRPDGSHKITKPHLVLDLSRNFIDYSPDEFLVYESLQAA